MEIQELFHATSRQGTSLERVDHRPWPLPAGRWLMGQSWLDLLFMHWRVPEAALRRFVPDRLTIETYEGEAWIGVTPFELRGLRLHGTIPLPGLSAFPELNVRTYVTDGRKSGIWFFSLDAAHAAAVAAARRFYRLPYHRASMQIA